jgi:hypothetical protein
MILRKILGILMVIAAAAGTVFSLVGLVEIWRYQPQVTETVVGDLALVDQALNNTQAVLSIVSQAVLTTTTDVTSLQKTTNALTLAIHDTGPMLDSLIGLTSEDLPSMVAATQTSLASAQNSALLIDNVLAALTSIPFSPVAAYKPVVPLHTALAQVSTSLDTLNPSLVTINTSLMDGKTSMDVIELELTSISDTTQEITTALGDAQTVLNEYDAIAAQLKVKLETAQNSAPTWILAIAWILSFVLIWLLIAQIGLGIQGLDLARE